MKPPSVLIIGGTWDHECGKSSYFVNQLTVSMKALALNGGRYSDLEKIALDDGAVSQSMLSRFEAVVWMPHIDNGEEKLLPEIKKRHPHLLLVSSKRVIEKSYRESDVVGRLLKSHSNLGIMIEKNEELKGDYRFRILDPLGNLWADTHEIEKLGRALLARIWELHSLIRLPSRRVAVTHFEPPAAAEAGFVEVVKEMGAKFATFINAVNPNRLLGNAATRCSLGFPASKDDEGRILVSRRNVDKTTLAAEDFVPVVLDVNEVLYGGENKPSVDAPIQLRLLEYYSKVRYIIHGHVYVVGAPFTQRKLPCGAIEEADEVIRTEPFRYTTHFAINLDGHGCLMFTDDYTRFKGFELYARPCPEHD